ncbi:MAG: ABC transporter permease [Cyclobacteriaceae bacterium]|nr:ABC transporter permease [Cyclobacteriaceae bacterium]
MKSSELTVIRASHGWRGVNLKELIQYRDLLWFLTLRGIKAKYAQSVLGVSWAVIQPLFSTLVFTVVFGSLARIDSNGVPYFLFSFTALVPWTFFSNTLTESANSLVNNTNMISKVYFPRLVLPLSSIFSKGVDFLISFFLLVLFLIYYRMMPGWYIVFLPWLLMILLMTSLGIGMILSAMAVQYRDVKHAMTFAVQLLMYAAPVVYPTTNVPMQWQLAYALNPMVGVIEGFRSIFLGTVQFPFVWVITGSIVALSLFLFGLFYFRKMERVFADVA